MRSLIYLLLLGLSSVALAAEEDDDVYRYVDEKGVIHFTDKPPTKGAKPLNLPKVQTFKANSGNSTASTPTPPPAIPQFSLAITSPTPDQTIRDTSTDLNVSVSVLPGLVGGYGLIYSLNGQAQNDTPIDQTSFTLSGVERGSHSVTVALVNDKGDEVASSAVTIHRHPPIVKKN